MSRKKIVPLFLFILLFIAGFSVSAQSGIDKPAFFNAMSGSRSSSIDAQLNGLKNMPGTDNQAFEGAMLMRKAGILTIPAKKLAMFKQGYKKLEGAISKNPNNAEYRFLRLIVQENAPRSLGYYKNINQDGRFVKDNYKSLPGGTQQAVISYSKKSNALAGAF